MSETELSTAERAALAARVWMESRLKHGPNRDDSDLLMKQLQAIYIPTVCVCSSTKREYCAEWDCVGGTRLEEEQPETWVLRTMKDVRAGDVIRPAHRGTGSPSESTVTARYLPPMKDGSNAGAWHVVSGGSGPFAHTKDHVVRPGEVWLCFDNEGDPRHLDPTFPVEILMDQATAEWLDSENVNTAGMGWEGRVDAR